MRNVLISDVGCSISEFFDFGKRNVECGMKLISDVESDSQIVAMNNVQCPLL